MEYKIQAIGAYICFLAMAAFLLFMQPAFASVCPQGAYCINSCDELLTPMKERTPFYFEGVSVEVCAETLNQDGIRVREEGTGSASVFILTTGKPFPFRSEWVGRRGRAVGTWYFEQYKA